MLPLKMPDVKSSKNPINLNWHVGIDQLQVAESKGLFLHLRFFTIGSYEQFSVTKQQVFQ